MTIAERIRELREARSLTQEMLAEKAGVAKGTITQYELGLRTPRLDKLQKLAIALNVPLDELVQRDDFNDDETAGWDAFEQGFSNALTSSNAYIEAGMSFRRDFDDLNALGQKEAVKRVHELTYIPEYTKED